jgi:hypothetical protein
MCDLLADARRVPTAAVQRQLHLAPVAAARRAVGPRLSWCTVFTRAYAVVAAARPELRRAYRDWPWPHLYEHPENVAAVAVERRLETEPIVFFGRLRQPQHQGLRELEEVLRRLKEEPVKAVGMVQRALRRLGLLSGRRRARVLGTFGVTGVSNLGSSLLNLLAPLTTTLTYGRVGADGAVDVRLTFDYRVLDGATAARVLDDLERVLNVDILAEMRCFQAAA